MTQNVMDGMGTGTGAGTGISDLAHGALRDLKELAREYLALSQVRLRDGAKLAKRGAIALAIAAVLGIVGLGQITYAIVGQIAARSSEIREHVQIMTTTAVLNLVIAGILAYVASRFFKKALEQPKAIVASTQKEDKPWQKTV